MVASTGTRVVVIVAVVIAVVVVVVVMVAVVVVVASLLLCLRLQLLCSAVDHLFLLLLSFLNILMSN
jgi:hypothetical protein